jgi:ATP-dependent Clp protease ATP-binding subunit ClpB
VGIQLRGLQRRLADRKLQLELADEAKTYLANAGYDPHFGARPLKRLIQHEIQDPLALMLLSGEVREGDTIVVEAGGDGLTLRVKEREEAASDVEAG